MLSSFSVLLLSPAADPVEPETVTLSATVVLGMKVAPQLWPRKQPSLWVFFFKKPSKTCLYEALPGEHAALHGAKGAENQGPTVHSCSRLVHSHTPPSFVTDRDFHDRACSADFCPF